jgi:hypothetical protein
MRSIWSFAPKVNLAAPGAIGGTTAGSGAFTTLTASETLAVTQGTTLSGLLTANGGITTNGGSVLLNTNQSLSGATLSFSSMGLGLGPDTLNSGEPTKWIAIYDNGTTRYIPTWSA